MVGVALKQKIEVLWSGGWDSTFMLCYLAKICSNAIIQPYYLDIDRPIRNQEIQAVKKIFTLLKAKTDLKAKILKPKIILQKFLMPDSDVVLAVEKFSKEPYKVGGQYKYIAQFAKSHVGICWGQERYYETPGHITQLLHDKGNIKFNDLNFGYFVKENCDIDVFTIFGNLTCPIMHFSEPMMWDKIKEWHYEDVFKHICFCYYPVNDEPCGMCYYCDTKFNQHMTMLFSERALARRKVYQYLKNFFVPLFPNDVFLKDFTLAKAFHIYQSKAYKDFFLSSFASLSSYLDIQNKVNDIIIFYRDYFDNLLEKALKGETL